MSTETNKDKNITSSEEALPSALRLIITNIAEKEDFITHEIESNKKPVNGANYMGDIYEVDIKAKQRTVIRRLIYL